MESDDRRSINRCEIPSAHVFLRYHCRTRLFNKFFGPFDLIDISKNSICIKGSIDFESCEKIEIWLTQPDTNHPIKMIGNIMRKEQELKSSEFIYVIRIKKQMQTRKNTISKDAFISKVF